MKTSLTQILKHRIKTLSRGVVPVWLKIKEEKGGTIKSYSKHISHSYYKSLLTD